MVQGNSIERNRSNSEESAKQRGIDQTARNQPSSEESAEQQGIDQTSCEIVDKLGQQDLFCAVQKLATSSCSEGIGISWHFQQYEHVYEIHNTNYG